MQCSSEGSSKHAESTGGPCLDFERPTHADCTQQKGNSVRKGLSVIRFVAWKRLVVPACFCLIIRRVEAGDLFDPSPLQWVAVVNPQALEWQPKEGKPRGVSLTSAAEHLQVSIRMEMCTMDMDGYKCDGHHYCTICIRIYIYYICIYTHVITCIWMDNTYFHFHLGSILWDLQITGTTFPAFPAAVQGLKPGHRHGVLCRDALQM